MGNDYKIILTQTNITLIKSDLFANLRDFFILLIVDEKKSIVFNSCV